MALSYHVVLKLLYRTSVECAANRNKISSDTHLTLPVFVYVFVFLFLN